MELVFWLVAAAALCLAYYSSRLKRALHSRDAVIHKLRSQLSAAERENLESKAAFTAISKAAFDLVILLDEACAVMACSAAAKALFGRQNPIGKKLPDLLQAPELIHFVQYGLKEDDSFEEQFIIGESHYRAKTQVVSLEGRRLIGLAMQDITHLVSLNRARRDLVANISHELRTPITRIRLIIEGLFLDDNRPKRKASIGFECAIHAPASTKICCLAVTKFMGRCAPPVFHASPH